MKTLLLTTAGLLGLLAAAPRGVQAQGTVRRHLVYLRDKTGTPFSVAQPTAFLSGRALARRARQGIAVLPRDLPVNPAYVAQVRAAVGRPDAVRYTSRWFNAVVVACDSVALARVLALPVVLGPRTQTLNRRAVRPIPVLAPAPAPAPPLAREASGTRADYGPAFAQNRLIGAVAMHDAGFRGEGMQIAVFDAGFPGTDQIAALRPLFAQGRLLGTRNFVDGGRAVFRRSSHGTSCLGLMAAEQTGFYIGTAPRAAYHLCLTEDTDSEHPVEEANWLVAAEYADSAGVDIISASLGYTTFYRPSPDYTYADMDGRTALSSRAAAVAARTGMLVVIANGNEGANPWRYVSAPADADSVLSVGAVDSTGVLARFSSVGPSADGRIKPTLAAMGFASAVLTASGGRARDNGTSYACPELAGLAAGLWQANPDLSAQQIIFALRSTATQAAAPDNRQGYGIPEFGAANALASTLLPAVIPVAPASEALQLYPNPVVEGQFRLRLPAALRGRALALEILDARGAVVLRLTAAAAASAAADVPVAMGQLAKGSYLCVVRAEGGPRQVVRFVQP